VLLLPSLSEGISNVVLEAMAAGVPVVSTRCGGMAEVVHDRVNGHLVEVGDTTDMADRLHELALDPDSGARLAAAGADDADHRLDLRFQIDRFVAAYAALGPR
jgi:colanic acid/amylovoran biosynthesis glycosyltransferase